MRRGARDLGFLLALSMTLPRARGECPRRRGGKQPHYGRRRHTGHGRDGCRPVQHRRRHRRQRLGRLDQQRQGHGGRRAGQLDEGVAVPGVREVGDLPARRRRRRTDLRWRAVAGRLRLRVRRRLPGRHHRVHALDRQRRQPVPAGALRGPVTVQAGGRPRLPRVSGARLRRPGLRQLADEGGLGCVVHRHLLARRHQGHRPVGALRQHGHTGHHGRDRIRPARCPSPRARRPPSAASSIPRAPSSPAPPTSSTAPSPTCGPTGCRSPRRRTSPGGARVGVLHRPGLLVQRRRLDGPRQRAADLLLGLRRRRRPGHRACETTHSYAAGSRTVTLTVTDDHGNSATDTVVATTTDPVDPETPSIRRRTGLRWHTRRPPAPTWTARSAAPTRPTPTTTH